MLKIGYNPVNMVQMQSPQQRQACPKMQTMEHDTVSFKGDGEKKTLGAKLLGLVWGHSEMTDKEYKKLMNRTSEDHLSPDIIWQLTCSPFLTEINPEKLKMFKEAYPKATEAYQPTLKEHAEKYDIDMSELKE